MIVSSSFWHSLGQTCDSVFSHLFMLLINVEVLVSFTGKNNFVVCDASLPGLTERSDRFETLALRL